jgi:hypothetical protein
VPTRSGPLERIVSAQMRSLTMPFALSARRREMVSASLRTSKPRNRDDMCQRLQVCVEKRNANLTYLILVLAQDEELMRIRWLNVCALALKHFQGLLHPCCRQVRMELDGERTC